MLYFIRHGQTDWNLKKRIQGITDIPLNKTGIQEAQAASTQISKIKWDRIISSPLTRAQQTAEILNQTIGLSIETDDRLCEFDLGNLEGKQLKYLTPKIWKILGEEPHLLKTEGLKKAYERISSFMKEISESPNTLIVTHSGLFKIISYYRQYPNKFDYTLFSPTYRDLWIPNTTLIPVEQNLISEKKSCKMSTLFRGQMDEAKLRCHCGWGRARRL